MTPEQVAAYMHVRDAPPTEDNLLRLLERVRQLGGLPCCSEVARRVYKPKVLVNPEYEDATPLGVELVAESLIEEGSKLQILLGLSKLGRTACAELQTEALTDVIMAEDQPERLAVFMFCMDELAFSPWDVTLPENKPSPLFAAVVSQSLDATTKEEIIEELLKAGTRLDYEYEGVSVVDAYDGDLVELAEDLRGWTYNCPGSPA